MSAARRHFAIWASIAIFAAPDLQAAAVLVSRFAPRSAESEGAREGLGASTGPETPASGGVAGSKPHILMILQDDLGHFDVGFTGNRRNRNVTSALTAMARDGIVLNAHYVHYWCSPTRRSFLTGRLPVHHGEMLSNPEADDMDLRWKLIGQKLSPRGYSCHWYGKGHTGFRSMAHLPTQRGFRNFTGFLGGSQSYRSKDRWQQEAPLTSTQYSTDLFGTLAVDALASHNPKVPFFLYMPLQAVHSPYEEVPGWDVGPGRSVYQGMLRSTDKYVGELRRLLELKAMWTTTLVVYSSDNGGRGAGNNFPYRGLKATNYEGGMRVAAFVSGGLIPAALRGTSSDVRLHIVDWYPTFCFLAGADPADDSPVPPLPINASNASHDIYDNHSWPGVDGVIVWEHLTQPARFSVSSAHPTLVLSAEVIIQGDFKLMTAQRGNTGEGYNPYENKWQHPDGTRFAPAGWTQQCGHVSDPWGSTPFAPCLFDLVNDPNETTHVGARHPELLRAMWTELNATWLTQYHSRTPDAMLGTCNRSCASRAWRDLSGTDATSGPICGVPGCGMP